MSGLLVLFGLALWSGLLYFIIWQNAPYLGHYSNLSGPSTDKPLTHEHPFLRRRDRRLVREQRRRNCLVVIIDKIRRAIEKRQQRHRFSLVLGELMQTLEDRQEREFRVLSAIAELHSELRSSKQRVRESQRRTTLEELQKSMEPLTAARTYNNHHCPLTSLPQEILLMILHQASPDIVSLYCLRRVSSIFRRLIYGVAAWKDQPIMRHHRCLESRYRLPDEAAYRLKFFILQDGLCDGCKPHIKPRAFGTRPAFLPPCKFWAPEAGMRFCRECQEEHCDSEFVCDRPNVMPSACKGRTGKVRLCEHVQISWSMVEAYVKTRTARWPFVAHGHLWDLQKKFLRTFKIECRDPSHETRCASGKRSSWPRATLKTGGPWDDSIFLHLEYTTHSGPGSLIVNEGYQCCASDLLAMSRRPGQVLGISPEPVFPRVYVQDADCVAGCTCDFAHKDNAVSGGVFVMSSDPSHRSEPHRFSAQMDCHWPAGLPEGVCLKTRYVREIKVARLGMAFPNPTHQWLHAMDVDTYPLSKGDCRDRRCRNYYRTSNWKGQWCDSC